jgi:DNA primase
VVELPTGHDPDTYLKAEGAEAYRSRLGEAPEAMEWLIRRAAEEHRPTTPAGKAAFLSALLPTLTRIDSAVERSAWIPRIVERGGLDEPATRQELRRALGTRGPVAVREIAAAAPRASARSTLLPAEKWLLSLLVQGGEGIDEALGELTESDIAPLRSAELLRAAKSLYLRAQRVDAAALAAEVPDEESRRLLSEVAVLAPPQGVLNALECVRELRRQPMKARLQEIQKKLNAGTADDELLREKTRLSREIAGS